MSIQNYEANYSPLQWVYGYQISNDATTPNTKLDIAAGSAFDSNAVYELNSSSPFVLNAAVKGVNGLDAGSLGASHLYAVYIIGDSSNYMPVASILSLASNSAPSMPFGYDSYRKIGYAASDGSSHFLLMYQYGNGNLRYFKYDAPQASAVTAGASATYAAVALTNFVPPQNNVVVSVAYAFTPAAASNVLNFQPYGATGDAVTITSQVTAVILSDNVDVMARLNSAAPSISYKISGGAVAINVAGFVFAV